MPHTLLMGAHLQTVPAQGHLVPCSCMKAWRSLSTTSLEKSTISCAAAGECHIIV